MCASESTTTLGHLSPHPALSPSTAGYCGSEGSSAELPRSFFDRQLIEHAMLNVVLNAPDALPEGGDVTITAALEFPPAAHPGKPEQMVCRSVAEYRLGMDDQALKMAGQLNITTKRVKFVLAAPLSMN